MHGKIIEWSLGGGFDAFWCASRWGIWPCILPTYWGIWLKKFKNVLKMPRGDGQFWDWLVHNITETRFTSLIKFVRFKQKKKLFQPVSPWILKLFVKCVFLFNRVQARHIYNVKSEFLKTYVLSLLASMVNSSCLWQGSRFIFFWTHKNIDIS